jgi:hypothetical protein
MATSPRSAAYQVLGNRHFISLITPWATGWPGLVLQRWQEFMATRTYREPMDDLAFTKMLVVLDDKRTLQLVLQAAWRLPRQPTTLQRFRFRLDDAVATSDASLVRRTLEFNEWIRRNITPWTWFSAVAYFKGSCEILDLIKSYATPVWTESRIRSQLFRKDLYAQATELFEMADVACLQWFVDNMGPASLPSAIVARLDQRLAKVLLVLTHRQLANDKEPTSLARRPRYHLTGELLVVA